MCDFKPGDEVVCVDDGPNYLGQPCTARRGQVYVVEHLDDWPAVDGGPSVYLLGVRSGSGNGGFRTSRFRKVQRRDLQAWLKTAAPAPHLDKRPKKRVPA